MDSFVNRRPKKDTNLLNNSDKYYQQALCEFASEIQDVLMKDQAVYFTTQLLRNRYREILTEKGLDNAFYVGQIDFREGCSILLVHQFKLYLKEINSICYVFQLLQSMKCVLEHQNCKKRSINLCWCLTMMTLMTLGFSCLNTIHMQYLSV